MLTFKGINALSDFQQKQLLQKLKQAGIKTSGIKAEYVHFADTTDQPSKLTRQRLEELVTYGEPFKTSRSGQQIVVVPRLGTISPWSSKATDIAHNSGLSQVKRLERGTIYYLQGLKAADKKRVAGLLHDRMTETILPSLNAASELFKETRPRPVITIDVLGAKGRQNLAKANYQMGLALAEDEMEYLYKSYKRLKRNPTDTELMMFGVVNSEHCRHKIFNADWYINGRKQPKSLFKMIRNTYEKSGDGILSAYSDNSAILKGAASQQFQVNTDHTYGYHETNDNIVIKVETHNHPTAIAPFPGAATGSGGEIRDEGATGRGARPKIGLAGYNVSNLNLPGKAMPWEKPYGKPDGIVTPLEIMLEAPLGAARFNNEFGRAGTCGYFRTLELNYNQQVWGYHKPIMIAGGLGTIDNDNVVKGRLQPGDQLVVLGGPAMLIGLGGGAAASMQKGDSDEHLDFASVQRANAEMQRRVQEVISACAARGKANPIVSIHDVGAGGLSNALPELVHDSDLGARFELRDIHNADPSLSPMEIWCSEAQERYVLGIRKEDLHQLQAMCQREHCLVAVVGEATAEPQLVVHDSIFNNNPVDLPMEVLFGKPPKFTKKVTRQLVTHPELDLSNVSVKDAVERVLQLPSVGSKKFLITIGDRNVGGLTARDQMVGPWQVPVSDVAVTAGVFGGEEGEAMTMGERSPLALVDAPASARMAIGESITNIAAAPIKKLSNIKLSANWMAASGYQQEDEHLYDTVKAIGEDFCPDLGITIPVGKDSLSMRTKWETDGEEKSVTSPLSLVITAFSPVTKVAALTPELNLEVPSNLLLVDLSNGYQRLGGSALAQVYSQVGASVPDAEARTLKRFFSVMQQLHDKGLVLAYHDRSDGGLLASLCEMAFASRGGLDIDLASLPGSDLEKLFNEELGVVLQVKRRDVRAVTDLLSEKLGKQAIFNLGQPNKNSAITFKDGSRTVYKQSRVQLENWWASTSHQIQRLRDNPACADQEYQLIGDRSYKGVFAVNEPKLSTTKYSIRPKVGIFREQGVNGQVEMAAAFDKAGFTAVDLHLNDVVANPDILKELTGLVACGGFSYGDVLGAGEGWAKSILFNAVLKQAFKDFFHRSDTFSLGVCNGCQMLSNLAELIPGAETWPKFLTNTSQQFEARLVTVKINRSPSIFFNGMDRACLPIPVAHGEGRVSYTATSAKKAVDDKLVALQYVDSKAQPTTVYPQNPNGSPLGIGGLTTSDGRVTIMMPHPERAFLTNQLSWHPANWEATAPWFRMFQNARQWVSEQQEATKPRTALLSVYNKDGIVDFARGLRELGFTLYASGGTRQAIADAGLNVTDVAKLTGSGAILDHRVVTLHPKVHGGILADTSKPEHLAQLKKLGIPLFDLVCVDMYPLEAEIAKPEATGQSIIEKIDIGGPTMINGAAKAGRIVLTLPEQRQATLDWLKAGRPNEAGYRAQLAARAFYETNRYYQVIVRHLNGEQVSAFIAHKDSPTKYGENPQQAPAAFYADNRIEPDQLGLDQFKHVQGMEKSYVNMTDVDRLLQTVTHVAAGFDVNFGQVPAVAVGVKHGNACGAAVAATHVQAVKKMLEGDERAIFGGVVMINGAINRAVAQALMTHLMSNGQKRLLDGVIGASVTSEALELLNRAKLRVIVNPALARLSKTSLDQKRRIRPVRGGTLEQPNYDFIQDLDSEHVETVGRLSQTQKRDLILAWAVGCTSNSNTITLVKNGQLIGNGVGQQDRVGAGQLALARTTIAMPELATNGDKLIMKITLDKNKIAGAVAYSDSFFPFPDGPTILAKAGIKAILASSGSVGDQAVKQALTAAGVSLVLAPDKMIRGFYAH